VDHRAHSLSLGLAAEDPELRLGERGSGADALAVRREDLDQVRALFLALAHQGSQLLGGRGAGALDPRERSQRPWTRKAVIANRVAQRHVGESADGLHRGEACHQRFPRGGRHPRRRLQQRLGLGGNAAGTIEVGIEVHVGIDPTRQHRVSAKVDRGAGPGRVERRDLAARDTDAEVAKHATAAVEGAVGEENGGALGSRRRRNGRELREKVGATG
jgi:hypothetical protein